MHKRAYDLYRRPSATWLSISVTLPKSGNRILAARAPSILSTAALQHIGSERLLAASDCGSMILGRELAMVKLERRCKAAQVIDQR